MARRDQEDVNLLYPLIQGLKLQHQTRTLTGDISLNVKSPSLQFLDPGGSGRTITLPAEASSAGKVFIIMNTADNPEVLTIQDDAPATVVTPTQDEMAILVCDGTTWRGGVLAEA